MLTQEHVREGPRKPARFHAAAPRAAAVLGFLALAALTPIVHALEASPGASAEVREGYNRAAKELLCYCGCARQTLYDCTCGVAMELRTEWERRLSAGATADQIIDEYIAEHGEQTRNVPPKKGLNLIAWFGPGIAIVVAGAAIVLLLTVWVARGRARAAASAGAADAGSPAGAADDRVRERLERELREFDA